MTIYFLFYFCSHLIGALPQKTWSEKLKRFELIFHSLISNTQSFKSEYLKSPIVPLAIGVTFQTGRSVAEKKNKKDIKNRHNTRSSWLNCSLRDDEAVYWFSIGHYEAVAVGN